MTADDLVIQRAKASATLFSQITRVCARLNSSPTSMQLKNSVIIDLKKQPKMELDMSNVSSPSYLFSGHFLLGDMVNAKPGSHHKYYLKLNK